MKTMEWKKNDGSEPIEKGWHVVLIGNQPHCAYYHLPLDEGWNIPLEWKQPTHYCKLSSTEDFWPIKSECTMD